MLEALVNKQMGKSTETTAQRWKPSTDFIERDIDAQLYHYLERYWCKYITIWRDIHVLK